MLEETRLDHANSTVLKKRWKTTKWRNASFFKLL